MVFLLLQGGDGLLGVEQLVLEVGDGFLEGFEGGRLGGRGLFL